MDKREDDKKCQSLVLNVYYLTALFPSLCDSLTKGKREILSYLTILFCLFCTDTSSQSLKFKHLSVEDGLSQANIWDIHQDKFGFIWIATEDGLNLYDGYTVTVFSNNPADSTTISNNFVYSIAEAENGDLWLGTRNGLNYYNRALNKFERFFNNPTNSQSLANNLVAYVYYDSKHNVWVGTARGLDLYNPQTKKFTHFVNNPSDPSSIANNTIRCILETSSNDLWVTTRGGICKLNKDGKSFTNYSHDPANPMSLSSNVTSRIFEDKQKNLWIGTIDSGLNLMKNDGSFVHYTHDPNNPGSISSNMVQEVREDNNGRLWVGTEHGLNLMDREKGTFKSIEHSVGNENGLSSNSISCLLFAKDESMWFGTKSGGVNIYMKDNHAFKHFKQTGSNQNTLSDNNVTGFSEDRDGNIWIAVDGGGVNYYNRQNNSFTQLKHEKDNINSLSSNKVLAVKADRNGGLWIGYWGGGLDYYDPKTGKFKHYSSVPGNPRSLSGNSIFSIMEDSKGNIWIGTWTYGLNKYNRETDDFTRYPHNPKKTKQINHSTNVHLIEDHEGIIWSGDEELGLTRIDPATAEIANYFPGNTTENPTPVYSVFEDSKHRIWVGTNGRGLNLFDRKTKTFKEYTVKDGLPNETVVGILEDNDGNLWLSTFKGLSKFNPEQKTFRNYYYNDGLQSNQFNRWAFLKLSTGEMLFGGINGFSMFNPADIKTNPIKPPVYITSFDLFNKTAPIGKNEVLKKNILFTDEIVLDYWQNFISFEFTALNYRQAEKNHYKYRLEGLEDEWIDAGQERKASYTNLNPGNYTFRVKASNNDGVWNEEGASIRITIKPPYWKTIWFKLGLVAALPGLFFSWFYFKINTERKQKKELEDKVNIRTSEVLALNDELASNEIKLRTTVENVSDLNKKLKLKEEWLTETQRIAKVGSWEYNVENDTIQWSDQIYKILGVDPGSGMFTIEEYVSLLHPDDRAKTTEALREAIQHGKSYELETRHKFSDGDIRWLLSIGKSLFNEKGKVIKVRGIAYDITLRKKAEISLKKSEEFFKALIQKSSDYVMTADKTGKIVYQSPTISRLTGYVPSERLTKHISDLVALEDKSIAAANIQDVIDNPQESRTFEVRLTKKDGSQIWVECNLTNLLNQPEVEALVINTREVTERKRAEEQLKQQNEELKKINGELDGFVYRASHDLRAPLSSILGLIGIAKKEKDEDLMQQYLILMEKSVDKLDLFIKNIIDYSRNSRLKIQLKKINFYELIQEAFEELKYMDRSEEIERKIEIAGDEEFYSDLFRLKIIFNNIISNAIRYSNPHVNSFIHIKIEITTEEVIILIADNGMGISKESIDKIFEMFYRATEQNVGSGLGLYIVKEAIVALKGLISVDSIFGKGTTFTIKIPNSSE